MFLTSLLCRRLCLKERHVTPATGRLIFCAGVHSVNDNSHGSFDSNKSAFVFPEGLPLGIYAREVSMQASHPRNGCGIAVDGSTRSMSDFHQKRNRHRTAVRRRLGRICSCFLIRSVNTALSFQFHHQQQGSSDAALGFHNIITFSHTVALSS